MKTVTAKSGILLTIMLVVALITYGMLSNRSGAQSEDCSTNDQQTSGQVQGKVNLKSMKRHLLDFYK
ncbi:MULTISPECIES: hypothetical protein [Phnomibacter]|uniref:Uncharacterized protein n=1 Tax=Phnomibacter ginsenosidimutans TaxID=2676868 RepID=A0A6I6GPC4_9BACT|nr:hypothetical protein [Phnomibacter ginsenosidimutans]MCA0381002.1 hypothetical protein [Bacteroidota bacterium]QGW29508.1 hypothetical protein GLV81_16575 [Phnomibacter ginsenosidimutans]